MRATTWDVQKLFFSLAFTVFLSDAQSRCYYPDGVSAPDGTDFVSCTQSNSNSSFAACCASGDECFTNGLCKAVGMLSTTAYWRNTCTDPTWQSDACPKYCYNESTSHTASAQSQFVLACSDNTYCCAEQSIALSTNNYSYCCDDLDSIFTAPPAMWLSGPKLQTPIFAPTSSIASISVSTLLPANTLSVTSSSVVTHETSLPTGAGTNGISGSTLNTGAKAGIGVGVALVAIIIAVLTILVVRRHQARKRHAFSKTSMSPQSRGGSAYNVQLGEESELSEEGKVLEMSSEAAKYESGGSEKPAELTAASGKAGRGGSQPAELAGVV